MASGIAANPALYALYKASGLLDAVAGGIALPDIKYLGTGVNLQTTVADLMRVGAMSGGILSSIGQMISAGGNGGLTGLGLLQGMGIGRSTSVISRGTGSFFNTSGEQISRSNLVGNTSSADIQGSVVAEAMAEPESKVLKMEDEDKSKKLDDIYELTDDKLSQIITILSETGIKIADYGLSNFGNPENVGG